jgi:hypothetical protein
LAASPFAGDDGTADPALAEALAAHAVDPQTETDVVAALALARVFVAVVAVGEEHAEMALVTLTSPEGRRGLPVFTTPEALAGWQPEARPVPATGSRVALSAVSEGCDLLVLDPAGPGSYVVRRPAVWALGQGRPWSPSYANPVVVQEISSICSDLGVVGRTEPGERAELRLVLEVPAGLGPEGLERLTSALSRRLGESEVVAEGVDSLEVSVRSV